MSMWELEHNSQPYKIMNTMIQKNHPHLQEAKIILYATDRNRLRANNVVVASASRAPAKLKASTDADFTITIHITPWSDLNQAQQTACLDHELMHCGVHYEPVKEQVGKTRQGKARTKIVRDEYGRVQYTNEIKRDDDGAPKWRMIPHDLEEFRDIVERHGLWDQSLQEFKKAIDGETRKEA